MAWLVACEYSGRVRDALLAVGVDAVSCDLLESEVDGPHIVGDVREQLRRRWDGVVAHPPCTRLCNSGVRWLWERDLWDEMREGAAFFLECLNANAGVVAVENPVMHRYGREIVGAPSFSVQPWQFGDNYKKRTCFWTRGLPKLRPTSDLDGSTAVAEVHRLGPSKDRWKQRSRTYPGIAQAIAEQWSLL